MNRPVRIPTRCKGPMPPHKKDCDGLMLQLQAVDFSMVDTLLYLDAYPTDTKALKYLEELREEREKLRSAMREAGCPPIIATEDTENGFRWTNGPWPWESDANQGG